MKELYVRLKTFENDFASWFLLISVFIFSFLRVPSLVEPDWYGDEGIYQIVGIGIRSGRLLYKEILDNKPPVLYGLYAFFNGDLFYLKLLSLFFGAVAIIVLFFIARDLFQKKIAVYISVAFFALLFGLPILEGNIANAENFMLAPILISAYLLIFIAEKRTKGIAPYIGAGLFLSLAFLTKIVAIFDFAAFLLILIVARLYDKVYDDVKEKGFLHVFRNRPILLEFRNELVFIASFVLPVVLVSLYFLSRGSLFYFLQAALLQNVGYVSYGNYFLFPMGFLFFKLILLAVSLLLTIRFRKEIGFVGIFILIWFFFSVFNAFFAERPYIHYLLVLLPSFSLLLGYIFEKGKFLVLNLFLFVIFTIFLARYFALYPHNFSYYQNYFDFILGRKNIFSYQSFFDANATRDFDIASFIKSKAKEESVFVWGDSAQIYAMAGKLPPGRYTVAYHILFYKDGLAETKKSIDEKKPKYIIAIRSAREMLPLLDSYVLKLDLLKDVKVYEREI